MKINLSVYGCDKILCKTGLIPIQRLADMCYIFHSENFEAFLSTTFYVPL